MNITFFMLFGGFCTILGRHFALNYWKQPSKSLSLVMKLKFVLLPIGFVAINLAIHNHQTNLYAALLSLLCGLGTFLYVLPGRRNASSHSGDDSHA